MLFMPVLRCAHVVSVVTFTAPVSPQLYKVVVRNVTRRDTYFVSVKQLHDAEPKWITRLQTLLS
jgi:hypothetical protein